MSSSTAASSTTTSNGKKIYRESDQITQLVHQTLQNHQAFLNTKYDSSNHDHSNLLKSIFKIIFSTTLSSHEVENHNLWTQLGFQHTNPTSDLRSLGLLGLSTMEYQCKYQTSLVKNEFMMREYPFACCIFAIVNFMVKEMNLRSSGGTTLPVSARSSSYSSSQQQQQQETTSPLIVLLMKKELFFSQNTSGSAGSSSSSGSTKQMDLFERLFCILFEYFDKLWVKHKASYMDFAIIYDLFVKNVVSVLRKEPGNYSVFKFLLLEW